ncbi:leucine-rich repeat protein [uncultured Porphyromonas sp.]|uniref:leucine-rich repeat protein n=1 Tax=uncultured Porphyromonas sp. TaxID=159274 RepID=UPI00260630A8|nr:leucine-rich repeat protein [uncultured Porphyromonas sp.]
MNRITNLLLLLVLSATALAAQTVSGNVLTSWGDATGAIRIPDGVTEIAANCFYTPGDDDPEGWGSSDPVSNTDITSVDLNGVTKIGDNAFRGCIGIKTIKAPKLESVGSHSFEGCTALEALDLPMIKTIGEKAFENANALTSLSLGKSLESIVGNPFQNSTSLTSLTLEEGCANYLAAKGALISRADGVLRVLAGGVQKVTLGEECKAIGDNAIFGCGALERLELPYVKEIGSGAFVNCTKLAELYLPRLERIKKDWLSFSGVGSLRVVDLHMSNSVSGLEKLWSDKETTTVYVASEAIKTELAQKLKKCQIIVGAPAGTQQRYKVTYKAIGDGQLEVWTTGARNVQDGEMLLEHSSVSFKASPRVEWQIKEWRVNGDVVAVEGDPKFPQLYEVKDLTSPLNVEVTFEARPEGADVYFRSRDLEMGTLTCKLDDGTEVKRGARVPVGTMLNFTATPKEGYRIGDWFEQIEIGGDKYKPIEGQNGKSTYRCEVPDAREIEVDFDRIEGSFRVKFASFNEKTGTLTATANGVEIKTGQAVKAGSKLVFTAHPAEGYTVDEWQLGHETVPNYRELTYTIESLKEDVEVNMVCSKASSTDKKPEIVDGVLYKWQAEGDAVLPDEVTYIAPLAFEGAIQMTSLKLNNKVKAIGDRAFLFCTALTKFVVPEANKSFSTIEGVLYSKDQTKLIAYPSGLKATSYTLGAKVTSIQPGAFLTPIHLTDVEVATGNTALKSVKGVLYTADGSKLLFLPVGNQTIEQGDKLALPEGLKEITRLALAYNPKLKELTLPASLERIDAMALTYNGAMKSFGWAEGVTPQLVSVGDSAFYYDRSLEKVPYMPSCTSFGKGAFGLASALKEVHIPAGCSIEANTFVACQIISNVYAYSVEPPVINEATFKDIYAPEDATLYVKEGAKEAYSKAKGWSIFGHIVEDATLAVAAVDALNIQLYPNPTQELLHVVGAGADSNIQLYDLTGALVGTARTDATGSAVVSLASYPAGTYVVRVSGADRLVVKQ